MLVRIPHYPGHSRQRRQFFRSPLRVASCNQDPATGIYPLQPPDRGARVLIRALGHRAGVQHNNFGITRDLGPLESTLQKLSLERRSIGLRRATTKILYVEPGHASILTE